MSDLVEREGVFYKKFTNLPFTGNVKGVENGSLSDGLKEGAWERYHINGQLKSIYNFREGS